MLEALLNFFDCLGEDLADLRVQRDRRLDAGGIEDICKTPQPNAFKAENVLVGIRHEKEGKLRVTYTGWDPRLSPVPCSVVARLFAVGG